MLWLAWVSAWLFVLAGGMLSYEVVARYFFVAPTSWAAELSQLSLIYGSLLAMPWLLQHRRHIRITALTARMPDKAQRAFGVAGMLILIVFSVIVAIYGWAIFADSFSRGRTTGSLLDLPSWIAEFPVPVMFLLLSLQAGLELWKLATGRPVPDGGHE